MLNKEVLRRILSALVIAPNGASVTVRLAKAVFVPSADLVLADITEADYTGYLPQMCAEVGVAWDDDDGNAVHSFAGAHFQPTGSVITNTIFGYVTTWAPDAGAVEVVEQVLFPVPIPMESVADAIDVIPLLKIGQPHPLGA